ncbi:Plus-3 domain protein [Ancylostoma caninum]|uniref:Plus-3 domain protein n=1 Tax=Ancylostoma caninum TaxID=29170 RepID=A0A368FZ38_ANCCA|nr:Plus-3 domain protein [Ancylostoma caninum]
MSSSDYSSSDDEEKKPKGSDDSDASQKRSKKRPTRNTSSKAIIESAGSSDSDNSDSDDGSDSDGGRAASSRKRKGSASLKKGSGANSAKRKRAISEESDRGEMDDDLFADEEDRRQVMAMNEKDREQEIFNRMEQQEMRRTRKQIEEKLAAAKNASSGGGDKKDKKEKKEKKRREEKKRINESDSDEEKPQSSRSQPTASKSKAAPASDSESEADMKFHRPSEVHKKATQKNAMADLLAKRKDKENKADGGSEDDEAKAEAKREVDTVQDLARARVSRYKIAKIVYAPFFAKTVTGCFVRVGAGGYGGKSRYRLSQVIDVVEMNRVYSFDNLKTNKGLKLKYGTDERVFRIEFVSNAEFGQEEFADWKTVTKEECGSLPTMDHIEKKEQDIKKAMNFNYTDEVIEYIVNEKKKFSDKVKNFAVTKGELMKKKVDTVQDLARARVSRYKIAKIVYAPFFAKTVTGCFVRVGAGGYGGKSRYRLSQVIDVVEMNRVYSLDNLKTNKGLKLKYGTDERVFRIEFVSNAEFGQEEFADWKTVTKEECGSLPTMDHIEKKEQDIKKAMNFNYTDEVIEYIVNEKKKFSDKVKNFAVTKGELMKKKVRSFQFVTFIESYY